MAAAYGVSQAALSLSFVLSFREISTVIPGIRTPEQARENAGHIVKLSHTDKVRLIDEYNKVYAGILEETEKTGTGKQEITGMKSLLHSKHQSFQVLSLGMENVYRVIRRL